MLLLRMEKSFSFVQGRSSGDPRLLTFEVKGVKRAACECVGGWMGGCRCSPPVITRRKTVPSMSAVSFSRSPWARALFTSVEVLRPTFPLGRRTGRCTFTPRHGWSICSETQWTETG